MRYFVSLDAEENPVVTRDGISVNRTLHLRSLISDQSVTRDY